MERPRLLITIVLAMYRFGWNDPQLPILLLLLLLMLLLLIILLILIEVTIQATKPGADR